MSQYLSDEEITKYCTQIPGVTSSDVVTASDLIDGYCGISFAVNKATEMVKVNRKSRGKLRHTPVIDITEVVEVSRSMFGKTETTGETTNVDLDPELDGYFYYLAPYSILEGAYGGCICCNPALKTLKITYSYGYSETPEQIKVVTAMLAQNIHQLQTFAGIKKLNTLDYTIEMANSSFFTDDMRRLLAPYKE